MITTPTLTLSFALVLSHFSATVDALPLADVSSDTKITTNICRIAGVYYEDSFNALAQFDQGELSVDDTYSPSAFRALLQSCCDLRTPVARLSASGVATFASSVLASSVADPMITPAPLDDLVAVAAALSSSSTLPDLDTPASVSAHVAVAMTSMSSSTLPHTIDRLRLSLLPYMPKIDMPVISPPASPSSVYVSASQGVSVEYSVPSPSSTLGLSNISLQDVDVNSLQGLSDASASPDLKGVTIPAVESPSTPIIKTPVQSASRPVIHGVAAGLNDLAEDDSDDNGDDFIIVIDSLTVSSASTGSSSAASPASPTTIAPHLFTVQAGSSASTNPETETTELPSSASETSPTAETSSAAPTDSAESSTSSPTATAQSTPATYSDTLSSAAATAESMSPVSQPSSAGPADMSSSSTSAFTSTTSTSTSSSSSVRTVTTESTSPVSQPSSTGLADTSPSTSASTSTVGPASSTSDSASATAPTSTDCDCAIEEAVIV